MIELMLFNKQDLHELHIRLLGLEALEEKEGEPTGEHAKVHNTTINLVRKVEILQNIERVRRERPD